MAIELLCVGLSGCVALIQILIAAAPRAVASGPSWALGTRDRAAEGVSARAERADRAARNMLETYPLFAAAAIAVVVAGVNNPTTAIGAQLYLIGRILYVPAYIFPLGPMRSLVWAAAFVGLVMVLSPFIVELFV